MSRAPGLFFLSCDRHVSCMEYNILLHSVWWFDNISDELLLSDYLVYTCMCLLHAWLRNCRRSTPPSYVFCMLRMCRKTGAKVNVLATSNIFAPRTQLKLTFFVPGFPSAVKYSSLWVCLGSHDESFLAHTYGREVSSHPLSCKCSTRTRRIGGHLLNVRVGTIYSRRLSTKQVSPTKVGGNMLL